MIGSLRKLIATLTLASLAVPVLAYAADAPSRDIPLAVSILGHGAVSGLAQYIGLVYQYAIGVAGMFAVILIMYGGMKWIFAAGDSSKISAAKDTIVHAVVGLIIALGSYVILNTINPAMVNLSAPAISTIQRVSPTSLGFCPNDGPFAGRFQCGDIYSLQSGAQGQEGPEDLVNSFHQTDPTATQCRGASCEAGKGGCFFSTQVSVSGTRDPYLCVKNTGCADTCEGITADKAGSITDAQYLCDSSACESVTKTRCWWDSGSCKPRIPEGQECDSDWKPPACGVGSCGDFQCAAFDNICSQTTDTCIKRKSIATGESCARADECATGNCAGGQMSTTQNIVLGTISMGITYGGVAVLSAAGLVTGGATLVGAAALAAGSGGVYYGLKTFIVEPLLLNSHCQ